MPVSDFIGDIITRQSFVPATCEKRYVIAVLTRFKVAARDSTYGKTFSNLSDLIQRLEQLFVPHKTYSWYVPEITTIQLPQNEGVHEFYDRLTLLKSKAQEALENRYKNANQMILPLNDCALEAFIRGLPDGMSEKIEARNLLTLEEAFGYAIDYEARHQPDRLFFQRLSRYQQLSYLDSKEESPSPEERFTPNGLSARPRWKAQQFRYNPNYKLDYQHEWKLHCTHQIDPETNTKMKERQTSVKTLRQRDKFSIKKSTNLNNINAFTVYDSAK